MIEYSAPDTTCQDRVETDAVEHGPKSNAYIIKLTDKLTCSAH